MGPAGKASTPQGEQQCGMGSFARSRLRNQPCSLPLLTLAGLREREPPLRIAPSLRRRCLVRGGAPSQGLALDVFDPSAFAGTVGVSIVRVLHLTTEFFLLIFACEIRSCS